MIEDGVNKVLEKHEGFNQININTLKNQIDDELSFGIRDVEARIKHEFLKFIEIKGIRPLTKQKRIAQLDTQIKQHIFNWQ